MKPLLYVVLLLAACGSTTEQPVDGGGGDAGGAFANCTHTCPTCSGGTVCFTPKDTQGFRGFCARPCGVTSDCPPGERCTEVFDSPGQPRLCVTQSNPMLCEGAFADPKFHCDFPPASCDGMILLKGFSQPANLLCGTEHEFCPGGCVPGQNGGAATCTQ